MNMMKVKLKNKDSDIDILARKLITIVSKRLKNQEKARIFAASCS
jgi:hypothetical protein